MQAGLREVDRGREIRLDHRGDLGALDLEQGSAEAEAGVVDEDVELRDSGRGGRPRRRRAPATTRTSQHVVRGVASGLGDLARDFAQFLFAPRDEEDADALGRERPGESAPEARGSARDQRDSSVQPPLRHRSDCIIRSRMDTISHSFAGAILSRSLEDRPTQWAALAVGAVAAVVPDLDFLLISNRIDYLRDHRSWTHSFLVLPFLALAIALAREDVRAPHAAREALALRGGRDRLPHRLRLGHVLRHDVLDAGLARPPFARLALHPRSDLHRRSRWRPSCSA